MNLEKLKESIFNTDEVDDIYRCQIDLMEAIGNYHKSLRMAESDMEATEIKANLNLANTLTEVCREKIKDIRDTGARLNYHFRMAAKSMLHKSTYNDIMKVATLPRKEVKADKKELSKNRYIS